MSPLLQKQTTHTLFNSMYLPKYELKNDSQPEFMIQFMNQYPDEIIETDHDESLEGMYVSEEEYWDKYYTDTPYEWNNGILEVKPLSDYLSNLLRHFFEDLIREYRSLGINFQQISYEIGFRMHLKKGKKIRKPDIGFVGPNSLQMQDDDCTYKGIFDLCVEFLSDSKPSEVLRDTKQKFKEYAEAGVKEYFILDRNETNTAFYRLKNGFYEKIDTRDGIVRSEVLQQFQFRIEHLYSRPDMMDLLDDPVYQHYVKRDYQKEKNRANNEKMRADFTENILEKEKIRADKQKNRADSTEKMLEKEKIRAEKEKVRADSTEKMLEKEKIRAELYKQKLIEFGISI